MFVDNTRANIGEWQYRYRARRVAIKIRRTAIRNCASTGKSFASLDAMSFFFVRFDQNFVRQIRCDAA